MASFNVDSELMNTWISAVPVPATRDVKALKDGGGRPMLLSLGNDGILYLIVASSEGQSGTHDAVNLTKSLGLNPVKDQITAFDAVQSLSSSMVYMAVAVESPGDWHRLLVLRPFNPSTTKVTDLAFSSLIVPQPIAMDSVKKIYMGSPDTEKKSYPAMVLSYEPSDRLKSQAIVALVLSDDLGTWKLNKELKLGENADFIIDLCSGTLGGDKGVFTLYSIQGGLSLKFTAILRLRETSLNCPKGAQRIVSIFKPGGDTDLVVAGAGLTYYKSSDMAFRDAKGIMLSDDPLFQGVKDLEVSVAPTGAKDALISIFASNRSLSVAYTSTSLKTIGKTSVVPIPLLPEGQGGYFSAFLAANGNQSLIVASSEGNVVLLEQAHDTLAWKRAPFNITSLDKNIELTCYQTRVVLLDSQNMALAGARTKISSTGSVLLTINGRQVLLDNAGVDVVTDAAGAITIVCPTGEISAYAYSISDIYDNRSKKDVPGSVKIDPANKVHERMLALVASKDSLKNAKSASGESLLSSAGPVLDDDLTTAARAMTELLKARTEVASSASERVPKASSGTRADESPSELIASSSPKADASWIEKAEHTAWSVWYWVERQMQKVKSWVIRVANGVHEFIIEIGNKVMKFVVDTITNISRALSWLWNNVLKVAWKKLVDFLGFLFSWDDILECKNSTYTFVNSALSASSLKLDKAANSVDTWFKKMEDKLRAKTMPKELMDVSMNPADSSHGDKEGTSDSAKVGWTNYQLGHGGALKNSKVTLSDDSLDAGDDELSKLFQKYIKTLADSLQTTATNIGNKLVMLLDAKTTVSAGTVLQALGSDLLVGILDLLRAFVVDLIKLGADIIRGIQSLLTHRINMPVFTALYEEISGKACNVLDIVCLILAIPITLMTKIITGNKPPLLPSITPEVYRDMVDGGKNTDKATQLKFNQMSSSIALGAFSLQTVCDIVEIAGSLVPVGAGIAAVAGGSIALDPKLVMGIIARAASFPAFKNIPGIEMAVAIWGLSTLATFVRAGLRKIQASVKAGSGSANVAEAKFLASVEIALAVVSAGLLAASCGEQYTAKTSDYPDWDKDTAAITYKLAGSTLTQIGTVGTGIAVLDPEPVTKAVASVVSGASSAAAYTILASRHYRALGQGKYADVVNKI